MTELRSATFAEFPKKGTLFRMISNWQHIKENKRKCSKKPRQFRVEVNVGEDASISSAPGVMGGNLQIALSVHQSNNTYVLFYSAFLRDNFRKP